MDVSHEKDGHWHFKLGPVERYALAGGALLLAGLVAFLATTVNTRLDKYGDMLAKLSESQAVASMQLTVLTAQLADVPSLTRQMAETKVRLDDNTRRLNDHDSQLHELQQLRKLR